MLSPFPMNGSPSFLPLRSPHGLRPSLPVPSPSYTPSWVAADSSGVGFSSRALSPATGILSSRVLVLGWKSQIIARQPPDPGSKPSGSAFGLRPPGPRSHESHRSRCRASLLPPGSLCLTAAQGAASAGRGAQPSPRPHAGAPHSVPGRACTQSSSPTHQPVPTASEWWGTVYTFTF